MSRKDRVAPVLQFKLFKDPPVHSEPPAHPEKECIFEPGCPVCRTKRRLQRALHRAFYKTLQRAGGKIPRNDEETEALTVAAKRILARAAALGWIA